MGSILYDYLNDRILFDTSLLDGHFPSISDADLREELNLYREFCISKVRELRREVVGTGTRLNLYGGSAFRDEKSLRQAALYLDCVVLPDPLFELTYVSSPVAATMAEFLKMPERPTLDRKELVDAVRFMLRARSLVAAGFVRFLPSSYYFEPQAELIVRTPGATFRQSLPDDVRNVYSSNTGIRSLQRVKEGWHVKEGLEIGRAIAIDFGREREQYIYHYFEQTITKIDDDTRYVQFQMTLPDTPPTEQEFKLWVEQSVDRSVEAHLRNLSTDLALAANCSCMYLTHSPFSAQILDAHFVNGGDVASNVAAQVLRLELPILEGVSLDDIMLVRANEGEAFQSFRLELEKHLKDLRLEHDPETLRIKVQNVVHELNDVQVTQARQKIAALKRRLAVEAAVGVAGLAATMFTAGTSLAATATALASGANTFAQFREQRRENPGYFLWSVKTGR